MSVTIEIIFQVDRFRLHLSSVKALKTEDKKTRSLTKRKLNKITSLMYVLQYVQYYLVKQRRLLFINY